MKWVTSIKIISAKNKVDLETKINEFLHDTIPVEHLVDIKMMDGSSDWVTMIIYREWIAER